MKTSTFFSLLIVVISAGAVRADVTLVQKIEGVGMPGQMTVKIKGDKVRIEMSPQVTTIFDGKTGEMLTLMNDEKKVVRISAGKMKAAAEMLKKFAPQKESAPKPRLVATGRKETINGYETEQFVCDEPQFKAMYWIASNFPNGAAILKELQSVKAEAWGAANAKVPDYRDFPGLPLRTRISSKGDDAGAEKNDFTVDIISAKQTSLAASDFTIPKDYKESTTPDMSADKAAAPSLSPAP